MSEDELYRDHARAEPFGSAATQYDRYRPTPPEALIDDLAALRPAHVLDVGCGIGKAAVALTRRGLTVLGIVWGSRSRPAPLTWEIDVLGRRGMIVCRVVAVPCQNSTQGCELEFLLCL